MVEFGCILLILFAQMSAHNIQALAPTVLLNSGASMPAIALGTYLGWTESGPVRPDGRVRSAASAAVAAGYRGFDTAPIYGSERELGAALRGAGRRELFLVTKVWNTDHSRENVVLSLRRSLANLGVDYIDLYLIHWPVSLNENYTIANVDLMQTWRGMEDAVRSGLARSVGLSNFNRTQLDRILKEGDIAPAVLQIEVHPHLVQEELVAYAQHQGLVVMAYSPFGPLVDRYGLVLPQPGADHPYLVELARKYGKTTRQVVLRWLVERGIVPVAKSTHPARLAENIDIFNFNLTQDEVANITKFNINRRYTQPTFWQSSPEYPFEKVDTPIDDPFIKLYNENKLIID